MSVKVIDWKKDGRWWVVTRHNGRRVVQLVGHDRDEAERRAREIRYGLKLHETPTPRSRCTVAEALDRWLEVDARHLSRSWRVVAESTIRAHLKPALGALDLRAVTRDTVRDYCAAKLGAAENPLSATTIRGHLSILGRVYEISLERGLASDNPTRGAGAWLSRAAANARAAAPTVEAWTRDEVARIIAGARALGPREGAFVALLFASGLRRGEALAIRPGDVDAARGEIVVRASITRGEEGAPKSRRARRVAVPAPVLRELAGLVEIGEGRLFSFDESRAHRILVRAMARSGARRLHRLVHATRHTYASHALESGASVAWVSAQLGHASPQITLRIYAHSIPHEARDLSFACFEGQDMPDHDEMQRHQTRGNR